MKLSILKLIIFSIVVILLTNCKKDKALPIDETENLYGEWVKSSGGLIGQTITPASEGYRKSVLFNKNQLFESYKNAILVDQMNYIITKGKSIFSSGEVNLIRYENNSIVLLERCRYSFFQ